MNLEKKLLKVKFVDQSKPIYEKEIQDLTELNEDELNEFLAIFIRLKKKTFYSKCLLEEVIPYISDNEMKQKVKEFLEIKKYNN